jgi:hypothetical protein
MSRPMSDGELNPIERLFAGALRVLPPPWKPWLENREGIAACGSVQQSGVVAPIATLTM